MMIGASAPWAGIWPAPPAAAISAAVMATHSGVGALGGLVPTPQRSIFSGGARDLWATLRDRLQQARVEVVSEVEAVAVLPWELLRDPRTDVPLALRADAFVRTQHQTVQRPRLPRVGRGERIRVLLVICRPRGR